MTDKSSKTDDHDPGWDEDGIVGAELILSKCCMRFEICFADDEMIMRTDLVGLDEEQVRRFCAKVVDAFNEIGKRVPV